MAFKRSSAVVVYYSADREFRQTVYDFFFVRCSDCL